MITSPSSFKHHFSIAIGTKLSLDLEKILPLIVFNPNDIPGYKSYKAHECPLCKEGKKIDALINSHGFSKI